MMNWESSEYCDIFVIDDADGDVVEPFVSVYIHENSVANIYFEEELDNSLAMDDDKIYIIVYESFLKETRMFFLGVRGLFNPLLFPIPYNWNLECLTWYAFAVSAEEGKVSRTQFIFPDFDENFFDAE